MARDEKGPEYVYLMEAVGLGYIKVGRAKDPFQRLRELQTGCPKPIVLRMCFLCHNAAEREAALHKKLVKFRSHGEWFEVDSGYLRNLLVIVESFGGKSDLSEKLLTPEGDLSLKCRELEGRCEELEEENRRLQADRCFVERKLLDEASY
jgi:hypothetical protein